MSTLEKAVQFSLPEKGEIFVDQVIERCKNLCAAKIWDGFSMLRLEAWMTNFQDPLERYFATCVLDAMIYRSGKQTVALMEQLFQRSIPDTIRLSPPEQGPVMGWLDGLRGRREDPGLRLIPVFRASDSPAKSGPLLARMYRRYLGLNERWMTWPWKVEDAKLAGNHIFVFIDDFLGTGEQFKDFFAQFNLASHLRDKYVVYAPLTAHETGLANLSRSLPFVRVCAAEHLDQVHGLFSGRSASFRDGSNNPEVALHYYHQLLRRKKISVGTRFRDGFGRLGLSYSFEHSTPNNSLPLLWLQAPGWESLFER